MSNWQVATLLSSHDIAKGVKSLTFKTDHWIKHQSGQHYNIRLTSADGYQAERDYSIASTPEDSGIVEFGVQFLDDGEVSPYLHQMKEGEQIEIKGPIGGHFIWDINMKGPLILIGGGSGLVPLMSMLRHYINNWDKDKNRQVILLISARDESLILYSQELKDIASKYPNIKIIITLTEKQPEGWTGYKRRIDDSMLTETFSGLISKMPMIYVCGPTPFVESVADNLVKIGFNSHEVFTERFG